MGLVLNFSENAKFGNFCANLKSVRNLTIEINSDYFSALLGILKYCSALVPCPDSDFLINKAWILGRRTNTIWTEKIELAWNSKPDRFETCPGQEIAPGIRIWAWEALKLIKNDEKLKNFEIHEISHEMHSPVDFLPSNIQISHADACVRCCAGSPGLLLNDS